MATRYSLNKNKYLLEPERQKLVEILEHFRLKDERNALLLLVALKTGARATELLNLKKSDLNHHDETVFLQGIKGSNDREIPLKPSLFQSLAKYSERFAPNERLFPIT